MFGLKKNRQPTEKTFDRSVTGESIPARDQKGGERDDEEILREDVGREGAGLVEYALILVLVAIVVIGVLTTMGTSVQNVFQQIVDGLTGA